MTDTDPVELTAELIASPAPTSTSPTTILAVVVLLGIIALTGLGGLIFLAATDAPADTLAVIVGPTTTALGALAAVLASTSSRKA